MSERLTVAQALVRFLAVQEIERDGERRRFFGGCWGIFGHGNLSGLGQALHQHRDLFRYRQARNEQAMVHVASGYARQLNRLGTFACTSSVGPGATNMVTGAALATVNRLPGAAASGRHVRDARAAPRAPAARGAARRHDVGERLLPPGVALLRPHHAAGADRAVGARGDARAHRPGRDRRGHAGAARGRPDRGARGAGVVPRPARVDGVPAPAGPRRAGACRRSRARGEPAADRRGRRRHLRGGERGAAGARRGRGHPGLRDAGGPRRAALRAPAGTRRRRRDGHARGQPAGPRGGSRDRCRDALERLHDRLEVGLPGPGRALRERQRRELRRRQAQRARTRGGRETGAGGARRGARGPPRRRGLDAACRRRVARVGRGGRAPYARRARAAAEPGRGDRRRQRGGGPARRRRLRGRLDAGRPAQALARPRPEGLPRRVRLLVHGLRAPGGHGREAGRPRPRGVRDGRRRLVADGAR